MFIHDKNTHYTRNKREYSSPDEGYLQMPTGSIILSGETLEAASLKSVQGQTALYHHSDSISN